MKPITILALLVFLRISITSANELQLTPSVETNKESATQKWLALQRSGESASSNAQPISGEVMNRVHQRYLKSFEKPIPEFYKHEQPSAR